MYFIGTTRRILVGPTRAFHVYFVVNTYVANRSPSAVLCASALSPYSRFLKWYDTAALAQVGGNRPQSRPATPRKSPPGLSGSGLRTPPSTADAGHSTRPTSKRGTPSAPSTTSTRVAGPAARRCADPGDGRERNGAPVSRIPEVHPKSELRRILGTGCSLAEGSRDHIVRGVLGGALETEGLPDITRRGSTRNAASSSR